MAEHYCQSSQSLFSIKEWIQALHRRAFNFLLRGGNPNLPQLHQTQPTPPTTQLIHISPLNNALQEVSLYSLQSSLLICRVRSIYSRVEDLQSLENSERQAGSVCKKAERGRVVSQAAALCKCKLHAGIWFCRLYIKWGLPHSIQRWKKCWLAW